MQGLHQSGVTHRDLKSSNILIDADRYYRSLKQEEFDPIHGDSFICKVADYESSIGIVGTGFWRAPEILLGLQNCALKPELFTQKSDVYSYAMTCYEILTGRMPFEGCRFSYYYNVLRGERPKLKKTIKPWLKEMLTSCWHQDPSARPTFVEILNILVVNVNGVRTLPGYSESDTSMWEYKKNVPWIFWK
jgi:serine/threonine protein kinase